MNITKKYSRLRSIQLPSLFVQRNNLRNLLLKRSSYRNFSKKSVSLKQLSEILYYSAGTIRKSEGELHRSYPSGGGKYPIEIYPLVLFGKDIDSGVYHFNPFTHSLEILLSPMENDEIARIWMSQNWFKKASIILILTAVYTRTTEKYGKKGLPFPLIEAGHIGQNIYLLAQDMKIGCCAIGQLNEKAIVNLLDINIFEEYPVYYIALGN